MINATCIEKKYELLTRCDNWHFYQIDVEIVEETGSTNADLLQKINEITKPVLLIAKNQTAGRGRAGRIWHSVSDGVLTMSLAWKLDKTVQELMGISLVVGVAIAEKLIELGVPVQLKWPNDILKFGNKLGGILIESQKNNEGTTCIVIGVGLNLSMPESLESIIGQQVADSAWLAKMDRNELIAHLLSALAIAIVEFQQYGFKVFRERWNVLNAHSNIQVNMIDHGKLQNSGIVIGVDDQGCLLLQNESGVQCIHAGDVSLRPI
jgi:BirA family biotin operon repressor/biotin-[acetyl-CoA-carboxylase] ligase